MPRRVGYAAGAFDLFHVGHLALLRRARAHCDRLIAGVVSDELLLERRGRAAVIPLAERLEIVSAIDCVDRAVVESKHDKLDMWRELRFTHFFKGDDWRDTHAGRELERRFAEVDVEVVYFPYTLTTSSTALRDALSVLEPEGRARA